MLSDLQGKSPEKRRSSVSPRRGQRSRKPRKDWLVAVGQGQSPASTRGQEDAMIKRKKFDISSLSFSGLEGQVRVALRSIAALAVCSLDQVCLCCVEFSNFHPTGSEF